MRFSWPEFGLRFCDSVSIVNEFFVTPAPILLQVGLAFQDALPCLFIRLRRHTMFSGSHVAMAEVKLLYGPLRMDPFPDWKTVVEEPVSGPRDWVKTYELLRILPMPDLHLATDELERQTQKWVLKLAELKAISEKAESDRQVRLALWKGRISPERPR